MKPFLCPNDDCRPGACERCAWPDAPYLRAAAQAVVDRWDSLQWEWTKHGPTADLMAALRTALAAAPAAVPAVSASELPTLPRLELSRDNLYGYPPDQMRAYGKECAAAAMAAERERIFGHIRGAMAHAEAGYEDVAWRLLASLVGPKVEVTGQGGRDEA